MTTPAKRCRRRERGVPHLQASSSHEHQPLLQPNLRACTAVKGITAHKRARTHARRTKIIIGKLVAVAGLPTPKGPTRASNRASHSVKVFPMDCHWWAWSPSRHRLRRRAGRTQEPDKACCPLTDLVFRKPSIVNAKCGSENRAIVCTKSYSVHIIRQTPPRNSAASATASTTAGGTAPAHTAPREALTGIWREGQRSVPRLLHHPHAPDTHHSRVFIERSRSHGDQAGTRRCHNRRERRHRRQYHGSLQQQGVCPAETFSAWVRTGCHCDGHSPVRCATGLTVLKDVQKPRQRSRGGHWDPGVGVPHSEAATALQPPPKAGIHSRMHSRAKLFPSQR